MKPRLLSLILLFMLGSSGCSSLNGTPDALPTGQEWAAIPMRIGDVWREEGSLGAREYVVEETGPIAFLTEDIDVIVFKAPDRLLVFEAKSGLFLAINAYDGHRPFWEGGRGAWIGFDIRGTAALIYQSITFAAIDVKGEFAVEITQVPFVIRPEAERLHFELQGTTPSGAQAKEVFVYEVIRQADGWSFNLNGQQAIRFQRVKEGAGALVAFEPQVGFQPHAIALEYPPARWPRLDEVNPPDTWFFKQSDALNRAKTVDGWPYASDQYVVRFAKYLPGNAGPGIPGQEPLIQNDTWEFEVEAEGKVRHFSVTRTTAAGQFEDFRVSAFTEVAPHLPCNDFPQPRSDPMEWASQLDKAGFKIHSIATILEPRQTRQLPGTPQPLQLDGRSMPANCDWYIAVRAEPKDLDVEGVVPVLIGGGWQGGDGIHFQIG